MCDKGHSEAYFGEERDFWWNKDFFELLTKRWGLNKYSKLLDVGCGCCHWSKLFSPYLKKPAEVYALDYDPKWAKGNDQIKEYFASKDATVNFLQGDAEDLPFPDEFFDVVTCQTVLIHLKDPAKAIREMKRVLKKGGIFICAEMNNLAGATMKNSLNADEPIEETLDRLKYYLIYEKGKKLLGEGDNSVGDLVPGMLADDGFTNIQTYLSDKASPMFSPYETAEEQAIIETLTNWVEQDEGDLDYEQSLKYFKAVSNDQANLDFFHQQFEKNKQAIKNQIKAIQNNQFSTGGAYVMYVVSGLKV